MFDLDPGRIATLTILKDASATAIYGSRASNGVVVIETRAPEPGKINVAYALNLSLTTPDLSDYDLLNARENWTWRWQQDILDISMRLITGG